jgi:hypothetical protein
VITLPESNRRARIYRKKVALPDQAPDGRKLIKRAGRKCAITVSIDPNVLERLDEWARGRGISRAAAIAVAVARLK